MDSQRAFATRSATSAKAENRPTRWLEWMLVIVAEVLFFQVIPDAWPRLKTGVDSIFAPASSFLWELVDVRQWSPMGTAIRLTVILLFLVGLKAWKDRKI